MSGAFLFGKLPAHGDFVARGLSHDRRDALDGWLAAAMERGRERHGAAFDDRYDAAPPWRFVTASREAGALVPSVDRVGRRFPLLLGVAGSGEAASSACEELIYRAFTEGWDADRLIAAVEQAPLDEDNTPKRDGPTASRWWTLGSDAFDPAELDGAWPEALVAVMLAPAGERR